MYECLKIIEMQRGDEPYYLTKFLDRENAFTFTVYTNNYPSFDVGTSYDLRFKPSSQRLNFVYDEQ